jgi:uncharacterized Zn-finger protein
MPSLQPESCSRDLSRQVRFFLNKEVFPLLPVEPMELPKSCQLHPSLDPYLHHEKNKELIQKNEWKCSYCNKRFKSEFYTDRHMQNKHSEFLSNNGSSLCLADLCPIFGCSSDPTISYSDKKYNAIHEVRHEYHNSRYGEKKSNKNNFNFVKGCTSADIEKNKHKCEVMMKKCFSELVSGSELKKTFQLEICDKLHCENGILKGSMIDHNQPEIIFNLWIFQVLIAVIILGVIFFYAISVELPIFTKSRQSGRSRKRD